MLGVDDWAWRKGRRYGTILVDLERHRVVDLLPDRTAQGLAHWLKEHSGVEVVARDRAGAYADGIHQGAPDVVQVADRWHLAKNLGEAIEELLDRHRQHMRRIPLPAASAADAPQATSSAPTATAARRRGLTKLEHLQQERRAVRLARYGRFAALRRQGLTLRAIARDLGVSLRTVERLAAAGRFPERKPRRRSPSDLDRYLPHLDRRRAEGCRRGTLLWREICGQGYTGPRSAVYTYLARLRRREASNQEALTTAPAAPTPAARRVSPRRATWLFLRPAADLDPDERQFLAALHERCADTVIAYHLAQRFLQLLRGRQRDALEPWLAEAEGSDIPELRRFAAGLRRDRPAVEAGVAEAWSNGQTEGQVNRLKLVRRTMYGRGKLDLLRQRVLRAA